MYYSRTTPSSTAGNVTPEAIALITLVALGGVSALTGLGDSMGRSISRDAASAYAANHVVGSSSAATMSVQAGAANALTRATALGKEAVEAARGTALERATSLLSKTVADGQRVDVLFETPTAFAGRELAQRTAKALGAELVSFDALQYHARFVGDAEDHLLVRLNEVAKTKRPTLVYFEDVQVMLPNWKHHGLEDTTERFMSDLRANPKIQLLASAPSLRDVHKSVVRGFGATVPVKAKSFFRGRALHAAQAVGARIDTLLTNPGDAARDFVRGFANNLGVDTNPTLIERVDIESLDVPPARIRK